MAQYSKDAEDVISFLKTGNSRACHNLVARHQNAVFRTCYSVIGDEHISEEIAQDVFLKAFKNLSKLDNPHVFRSWILSIAYRTALDQRRKKRYYFDPIDKKPDLSDGSAQIDEKMSHDERKDIILNSIKELGEPDSSIFILFYLEEMSTEEIAKALGLGKSNVKIKLMRGREKLRNKLRRIIKNF